MGAREVERLDDGGARECAEEEVECLGGLENGLCGVVVGEGEGEVGTVGGMADEGRDDFVGEFGGEGGVGEVFEGELGGLAGNFGIGGMGVYLELLAVHVPEPAHEDLVLLGEGRVLGEETGELGPRAAHVIVVEEEVVED